MFRRYNLLFFFFIDFNLSRRKLIKEDATEIKVSITRMEEDWENKWAVCLKNTPLTSFLIEDPVSEVIAAFKSMLSV